jgi:hypothetical protein
MSARRVLVVSNGYSLDFSEISRMIECIRNSEKTGKQLGSRGDLATALGSSMRRVEALHKLGAGLGIFEQRSVRLTPLGTIVAARDQYFDDPGTLWLVHFLIGSQPHLYVWNRLVNSVVARNAAFSFDMAKRAFSDARVLYAGRTVMRRVQKEITTFLNAYTQQKFENLAYIREAAPQIYRSGTDNTISAFAFFITVASYRERFWPGAATLDTGLVIDEANSPGRVLNLTRRQVRDLLEEIEGLGYLYVETRADLDQVR